MSLRPDTIRPLSEAGLLDLGTRAFQGLGLNAADAATVARILVTADLFGLTTHGLSRIESYGDRLPSGRLVPAASMPATPRGLGISGKKKPTG